MRQSKRILVVSGTFPSAILPIHGVFVKERLRYVAALPGNSVSVVAPTPYFPPLKFFRRWYMFSQLPKFENVDGLDVYRPRYLLPPKIGGYFHPQLMSGAVRRGGRHFGVADIDLIDAHFIYPDGVAASYLAKRTGKPLVITCRGEDIVKMPDYPFCGKPIREALKSATRLIAVSGQIRDRMIELGAEPQKVHVISNGVDTKKFAPVDQGVARERCGLNPNGPIIVSVGYRLELKGFHILIEAASRLRGEFPDLQVAIVGGTARWGNDFTPEIEQTIERCGMEEHVILAGPRPQQELVDWYSAADLFGLFSSREGSPNVLMEALACGTPAVATPVGGIPEVLADSTLGTLLRDRSVDAAEEGLRLALGRQWDRNSIRRTMENRSWQETAEKVDAVFGDALSDSPLRK